MKTCVPYYSSAVAVVHETENMTNVTVRNLPIYCPTIRAWRVSGSDVSYVAVMMDISQRPLLGYFEQGVPQNPVGEYRAKPIDDHWAYLWRK